jgi:hypothetical protein
MYKKIYALKVTLVTFMENDVLMLFSQLNTIKNKEIIMKKISISLLLTYLLSTNVYAQIEEITVYSPRLSFSGNANDFRFYIASLSTEIRQLHGISGDITAAEKQCEAHAERERARCESRTLAGTVGIVKSECQSYLVQPNSDVTFTSVFRGLTGSTRITTATGIELYDRCVTRANQREQAILRVCENLERLADCEFSGN